MKMRKKIFSSLVVVFLLLMLLLCTTGCLSVKVFHQLAIEPNDQFYVRPAHKVGIAIILK